MDVGDDLGVGGAVQRFSVDFEDLVADLQIGFVGRRSWFKKKKKVKKKKKEKKKRANQSAGPVAMAALAPPQMRRPVAVLDRLDRRVFDERFNNDNRSNIRSV